MSVLSRFYDPIGIVSPITVQLKVFAQQLCKAKMRWDDPLSDILRLKWESLLDSLRVQPLSIPRSMFSGIDKSSMKCQLHGFCDASSIAYAAVVYMKIQTPLETVVRFVASRTRVAPIQTVTIPRLELLSALLLAKLVTAVSSALITDLILEAPICYTDSTVTLFWIRGEDQEWKQFVQNRVTCIRSLVSAELWKHCPGISNPADIPSRGTDLTEASIVSLWLDGPDWLSTESDYQEHVHKEVNMPEECLKEARSCLNDGNGIVAHSLVASSQDEILRCENFSSLTRLLRVTAFVFKFIQVLKSKITKTESIGETNISVEDMENSEFYWVKILQKSLPQTKNFSMWKMQFGLYVDSAGMWRCGGRLNHADLTELARHPILLDTRHYLTTLIVTNCHHRVMHGGVKETLTELRSRYWIVKGRSFVKKIIHECVVCVKFGGKPYRAPPPPPLPEFRVQKSFPFSFTGVDFAGPLYLKGTGSKVWIVLFTCCSTRAVHLELVLNMTAEAFICSFRRFTSRRGIPSQMISDNGKTFVSANKMISSILREPQVKDWFTDIRVKWRFNLERAPWWGGFFERMVQSTKNCLKKVVGKARLSHDELTTVLAEVEATINSRPLMYVSLDDIEEPLTPSHLLVGRRLSSLPDPSVDEDNDEDYVPNSTAESLTKQMSYLSRTLNHFWNRWKNEYLLGLRDNHRFSTASGGTRSLMNIGDVVLIQDENQPRTLWKLGRIEKLLTGSDGRVRGARLRVRAGNKHTSLKRPMQLLYPVEVTGTLERTQI